MFYLRYLYSFAHHILCCGCGIGLFFFVLCTLCWQFLWIFHFWLPPLVFSNVYLWAKRCRLLHVFALSIYLRYHCWHLIQYRQRNFTSAEFHWDIGKGKKTKERYYAFSLVSAHSYASTRMKGVGMTRAETGLKNRQIINETYSFHCLLIL